ncbi:MAG: hypothetical protein IJB78_01885 [Oscillospiraceae bacterium]|nr:hypothetical protein [Oscillospiraceae bacterium]
MSRDFKKELEGFESVWKRVTQSKAKMPKDVKLMPKKSKNRGRKPNI